ncbi:MAG: hypothetical protein R2706_16595 [Acidimicrobiales bacterium]
MGTQDHPRSMVEHHEPRSIRQPGTSQDGRSSYAPPEALIKLREIRGNIFYGRSWPLGPPVVYD